MTGRKIRRFDHCESTNDIAAAWAGDVHDPAPHGGVIVADSQTAGRGRLGRQWHSPPGENLYFSCVLRPNLPIAQVPPVTLCAGLAVCEVVNSLGVPASIKWPNDIWVGRRKLAGILTEMSTRSQQVESVIVGIGVNVNSVDFPADLHATSIRMETKQECERSRLLDLLLEAIDQWVERYCTRGISALAEAFERHSLLSGRDVQVRIAGRIVDGRVQALGEDGSLVLVDSMGTQHKVIAGEVHLLDDGCVEGESK